MSNLYIDTATKALILILTENGKVKKHLFQIRNNDHSERLLVEIDRLFQDSNLTIKDVNFYVGMGPGSYTGVRIGVIVAKMFAYTLNKPLYQASSLALMAASFAREGITLIPIIDARRGNAFSGIYQLKDGKLSLIAEERLYALSELFSVAKKFATPLFVGIESEGLGPQVEREGFPYQSLSEANFNPDLVVHQINYELVDDIHHFAPNYKRMTEAERNLYETNH